MAPLKVTLIEEFLNEFSINETQLPSFIKAIKSYGIAIAKTTEGHIAYDDTKVTKTLASQIRNKKWAETTVNIECPRCRKGRMKLNDKSDFFICSANECGRKMTKEEVIKRIEAI